MPLPDTKSLKINLLKPNKKDVVTFFYKYLARATKEREQTPHPMDYRRYDEFSQYYKPIQIMWTEIEFIDYCQREKRKATFPSFSMWMMDYNVKVYSYEYCLAKMLLFMGHVKHADELKAIIGAEERKANSWFPQTEDLKNNTERLEEIAAEYYS